MKTKMISRILEGIFLFSLILMIYIMSIFSANGQMMGKHSTPYESMLSYSNEQSFDQERIMTANMQIMTSSIEFERIRTNKKSQFIPGYLVAKDETNGANISFPKPDMRRRRMKEHQAPSFIIPLN